MSVKVKCPDPGVASHDQKPDRGIVSGIKSPPVSRTSPPPTGFTLIGALCQSSVFLWKYHLEQTCAPFRSQKVTISFSSSLHCGGHCYDLWTMIKGVDVEMVSFFFCTNISVFFVQHPYGLSLKMVAFLRNGDNIQNWSNIIGTRLRMGWYRKHYSH